MIHPRSRRRLQLWVDDALSIERMADEQDRRISEAMEELDAALDELPEEQREVFLAHELDGRSFKELAAETGLSVNTLRALLHPTGSHVPSGRTPAERGSVLRPTL